jgi:hypothetical protein
MRTETDAGKFLRRAIICVRLHDYRGNPVISSMGESRAILGFIKHGLLSTDH